MPYRFKRRESVPESVRRILREQCERAAGELDGGNPDAHEAVHNARKRFKKIRSLLRLVRGELGKTAYRRENDRFRRLAHRLAAARDAETLIESYDSLIEDNPAIADLDAIRQARENLVTRRDEISDRHDLESRTGEVAEELRHLITQLDDWPLSHKGFSALARGFKQRYKQGCKRFRQAYRTQDAGHFHEWRKRVKDDWYHTRMLRRVWRKPMKARASALKTLSDLLGDDHDLSMLRQTLRKETTLFGEAAPLLACLAEQRQQRLRQAAYGIGRRLYAAPPSCRRQQMAAWWKVWKADGSDMQ